MASLLVLLMVSFTAIGQRPCRDTVVHFYDSICDGQAYDFNGRTIDHAGLFWDTVPRQDANCDSVMVLHLAVLQYPYSVPVARVCCHDSVGYHLYASLGNYFQWSSSPTDSSILNVGNVDYVFVSPRVPTTYTLVSDWRVSPQCPSQGSVKLNPVDSVHAVMKVWPKDLVYENMQVTVEDRSTGNLSAPYGGWVGRKWYINGQQQSSQAQYAVFQVQPWMGDSVEVKMVAYNPSCVDSVSKVIPFLKGTLHFPNIFFPSQEENNRFCPSFYGVPQYELKIFDRRGALVFSSSDTSECWDGFYHGRPCAAGTYVYHCRYVADDTPNGFQEVTGTVTLLR